MFFKGKLIKMLIEENRKKDKIISKLMDRLMARNFQEFKQFEPELEIKKKEEKYKVEFDEELIGEIVDGLETK